MKIFSIFSKFSSVILSTSQMNTCSSLEDRRKITVRTLIEINQLGNVI
jgi:hypothetical protein